MSTPQERVDVDGSLNRFRVVLRDNKRDPYRTHSNVDVKYLHRACFVGQGNAEARRIKCDVLIAYPGIRKGLFASEARMDEVRAGGDHSKSDEKFRGRVGVVPRHREFVYGATFSSGVRRSPRRAFD